ncbi:hypothetical protein WJX77_006966 [Trebouxia sp. C0004]
MTSTTSTGAVSLLTQLASADPYTALENSDASDCDDAQCSLDTAASVNVATAREPKQVSDLQSPVATQNPVSTLQMLQQLIKSPSSLSTSQKNGTAMSGGQSAAAADARVVIEPALDWQIIGDFCSRTVSRKWLRLVLHGWHQAIKSKIKWRCIEQELLLRQCRAFLHGWHRTAALESKRAYMLADHMRKAHTLQIARLSFTAWREASEVATAQSCFIIQSLAASERAVLTAALRGWKARCQLRHCATAFRARCHIHRAQHAFQAWQQWYVFKRCQQVAAAALQRRHLTQHALHCWYSEWLPRVRSKQQLARQQAYKVQLLQDRWGLHMLHAIVPAWRNLIAAQAASRRRLRQTVQRVYLQRLLQSWHMRASGHVQLKIVAFTSWKQAVVWQQRKPLLLCTALSHHERRFLHKAVRGWVLWWYRQASGMLIAARHRQLLAATAVHVLQQHTQLRKSKYAMWRAAARQRLRTVFRGLHRGCAVSKLQQCMHELAVMFHWASLARTCLRVWQKYAEYSTTKKEQWVAACEHHCTWIRGAGLVHWARWSSWQQRKALSHALGRRTVLQHFLAQWRMSLMQHDAAMSACQAILQGWYQLVLHKREAEAVLLRHCLKAWAAVARKAGLLRFLLIEHAAIRQGQQKGAVLDAWRQLLLSSRAAVAFHATQGDHTEALRSCSLAAVRHLDGTLLQKAVQGWHAVVIQMASRRARSQQTALASAERAVRKGCQAAAGNLVHEIPSDQIFKGQHDAKVLWQTNGAYQQRLESCAQDLDVRLLTLTSHQQMLSHKQADPPGRDDQQTPLENNGSCSLLRACGKAQKNAQAATQYDASLLARAMKAWQMMTSQAVAQLFRQHEFKAEVNQQILQVVGAQQQAHEHRARHLLICAFYPWLEMSLKPDQDSHDKPQRSSSGRSGHLGGVPNRSFLVHSFLDSSLPGLAAAANPCDLAQQPLSFLFCSLLARAGSVAVHHLGSKTEGLQDQESPAVSLAEGSEKAGRMQARAAYSGCSRTGIPGQMCQNSTKAFTSIEVVGHRVAMGSKSDRQFSVRSRSSSRSAVRRSSSPACCSDTGQQAIPAADTQSDRRNRCSKSQPACRGAVSGASLPHGGAAAVHQNNAAAVGTNNARASLAARDGQKAVSHKQVATARQTARSTLTTSNRQLGSEGQAGKGLKGSNARRKSLMKALARTTPTRAPTIPTNLARSEPSVQPPSTGITSSVLPATSQTAAATVAMDPAQAVRVLQPLPDCTNQPTWCDPMTELLSQKAWPQHAIGSNMLVAQAQPPEQVVCVPESVAPVPAVGIKAVKRSLLVHPEFC